MFIVSRKEGLSLSSAQMSKYGEAGVANPTRRGSWGREGGWGLLAGKWEEVGAEEEKRQDPWFKGNRQCHLKPWEL